MCQLIICLSIDKVTKGERERERERENGGRERINRLNRRNEKINDGMTDRISKTIGFVC